MAEETAVGKLTPSDAYVGEKQPNGTGGQQVLGPHVVSRNEVRPEVGHFHEDEPERDFRLTAVVHALDLSEQGSGLEVAVAQTWIGLQRD